MNGSTNATGEPQICATCRFCAVIPRDDKTLAFQCRRRAAVVFGQAFLLGVDPSGNPNVLWATNSAWPGVGKDMYCGEFEPVPLFHKLAAS